MTLWNGPVIWIVQGPDKQYPRKIAEVYDEELASLLTLVTYDTVAIPAPKEDP
jgi:hypothetical protein